MTLDNRLFISVDLSVAEGIESINGILGDKGLTNPFSRSSPYTIPENVKGTDSVSKTFSPEFLSEHATQKKTYKDIVLQ